VLVDLKLEVDCSLPAVHSCEVALPSMYQPSTPLVRVARYAGPAVRRVYNRSVMRATFGFTRAAVVGSLAAVIASVILAQQPTFDVASVKVVQLASHPVFGNRGGPGTSDPGRVHLCCVGLYSLLMRAYDVELDQIRGPSWIMENMGPNLYEIDATMSPNTTQAEFQLMMRNLLEKRFHLQAHSERRNFPGYELTVADGGPKLKASRPDPNVVDSDASQIPKRDAGGALILPPGPQMLTTLGQDIEIVQVQQKPISDLVRVMGRMIAQSLGENPNDFASLKPRVIDKTRLTGNYDFTLRFSCEFCQFAGVNANSFGPPNRTDAPNDVPNIFVALQKQLGLKLVKIKEIPLDVIVVDHVDKTPTAN